MAGDDRRGDHIVACDFERGRFVSPRFDPERSSQSGQRLTAMLAQLHFRGNRPRDAEGWRAVFQVLKAVSGRAGESS